jgi:hypothetical protein
MPVFINRPVRSSWRCTIVSPLGTPPTSTGSGRPALGQGFKQSTFMARPDPPESQCHALDRCYAPGFPSYGPCVLPLLATWSSLLGSHRPNCQSRQFPPRTGGTDVEVTGLMISPATAMVSSDVLESAVQGVVQHVGILQSAAASSTSSHPPTSTNQSVYNVHSIIPAD